MTEGAEACPVLGLKISPIQVFMGPAKVMGEIADSLGMGEVDQGEGDTNSQLLSPTLSRLTQMPCRQIMRYTPQETLCYFYSTMIIQTKIILYTSKKIDLPAKSMEVARTIIAAWGDCRVSVGIVLNDRYVSMNKTFFILTTFAIAKL
jgi:hypothetical protein